MKMKSVPTVICCDEIGRKHTSAKSSVEHTIHPQRIWLDVPVIIAEL